MTPRMHKEVRRILCRATQDPALRNTLRGLSLAGLLPQAIWRRLPVEQTFRVAGGEVRFLYESGLHDDIGRYLYWTSLECYEPETLRVFLLLVQKAKCFVDVGANTGVFTLIACASNRDLSVVAFEPVPRVFERLERNVNLNGFQSRCTLRCQAVAATVCRMRLHVPAVEVPKSASFDKNGFRGLQGDLVEVDTTTIDHARKIGGPIDLVKIDTEGFEHIVLAGMHETLSKDRPIVILECHVDGPAQSVQSELDPYGYVFYHCRPHGVRRSDKLVPDPAFSSPNWLCVPENRCDELEKLLAPASASAAALRYLWGLSPGWRTKARAAGSFHDWAVSSRAQATLGAAVTAVLKRALGCVGLEIRRLSAHQGVPQVEDVGFPHVLEILFRCAGDLTFVQVGANDGVLNDLLCPFLGIGNPRGILVEPQAEPFRKLLERYGDRERLKLYRGAVDTRSGTRTLYRCREDLAVGKAAALLSGLASFDRSQVIRSYRRHARRLRLTCPPESAIVAEEVRTITLESLLHQEKYERCDLLVIDTEGHDFEIIRTIDFSEVRPLVLIYEHTHLGRADRLACWRLLRANGYRCAAGWSNTLALLTGQSTGAANAANGASALSAPSCAKLSSELAI